MGLRDLKYQGRRSSLWTGNDATLFSAPTTGTDTTMEGTLQ